MTGINKVLLIGHLGRDPEIRTSQGGEPIASFSMATSESWHDKATSERKQRTEWRPEGRRGSATPAFSAMADSRQRLAS